MLHAETLGRHTHTHDFASTDARSEQRTIWVFWLTISMMAVEIAAGIYFGSMALLADGWHMGTHAAAFGITLFAYYYARKNSGNAEFSFGTGKVSVLGGFGSAAALATVALMMGLESVVRFFNPQIIQFNEAIAVAVLGLLVNLFSAWLLQGHEHGHDHHHGHHHHDDEHEGHHSHRHGHTHDHNLRAAYMHVLADALTSILAIAALLTGKYLGWNWLDPMMGIVGAVLIARWSIGLLRETSDILLDRAPAAKKVAAIREQIEQNSDNRISDLHVWPVGPNDHAAIISLVTDNPRPPEEYKRLLHGRIRLSHVTVEINPCLDRHCPTPSTPARQR